MAQEDPQSPGSPLLHAGGSRLLWWAVTAIGLPTLGVVFAVITVGVAALALLAGMGAWSPNLLGSHPPVIATPASRPAQWLPTITADERGLPNALVLAVMEQASDGEAYGDRYYCSNGQSAGEACGTAYSGTHTRGIGYGLLGIDSTSGLIPKNQNPHSVAWNVQTGTTALRHTLLRAKYWQPALQAFHQTIQTPNGWPDHHAYAHTIPQWLGTYQIVTTNGKTGSRTHIQRGIYDSGPHLGAWAMASWSHKTGQFTDPGNRPQWVLAVGMAPTGPRWSHLWKPPTTEVIPPAPHSHHKATTRITRYYVYGHTLLSAKYWQPALQAFHQTIQTPNGWHAHHAYAHTLQQWLGTYQIVTTNGKTGSRTHIQRGIYDSGPHLGAWAIASWRHKTGQFTDPGNHPEWVLAVGIAPTGPRWSHGWKPPTIQVIPPAPHSNNKATTRITRYYVYGQTLTLPISVVGVLKNGQHVAFGWSGNDKKIPMWPGGGAFGAKVPLTGPQALVQIHATWANGTQDTIPWPEQSAGSLGGAVGTVIHVPPTQAVRLWWKDIGIASQKTGVPADWLAAEMLNESGGNPAAGNPTGAYGLMQLEPATAHGLPGYTPGARHNPLANLILGAELLDANYRQWHSWRLASAAYYGGSGRVQGAGVVPGMPWRQASGRLMVIPDPRAGNALTMTAYANNIEATSHAVAAMPNK